MTIERPQSRVATVPARLDMAALVRSLRPKQWTKNAVVLAALVFDHRLLDGRPLVTAAAAFVSFCLASSAVYLLNDLRDVESDRLHPAKRDRPIASGRVTTTQVWGMVALLLLVGLPLAIVVRPAFAGVVLAYLALMVAYTLHLKHLVIVDVFAISAGFVLRAAGGAVALDVPISPWLYVCTILLSLFIGFGKRRHELLLLEGDASGHRRNLEEYSAQLLDQFILITSAATVMGYSLYTFSADNLPENHSMMLTIPFVLYAIFRYLFLVHRRDLGGSPEQVLVDDKPLLVCIVLWGLASVVILYGPWS